MSILKHFLNEITPRQVPDDTQIYSCIYARESDFTDLLEVFNPETDLFVARIAPYLSEFKQLCPGVMGTSTGHNGLPNSLYNNPRLKMIERVFIKIGPNHMLDRILLNRINRVIHSLKDQTIAPIIVLI